MAGDANEGKADDPEGGGVPDALRAAVERTFAAVAEPRGRAQDLLGDLTRRGQETREDLGRKGIEAREASAAAATRLTESIERLRLAGREDLKRVEARVKALEDTVERLQQELSSREPKDEVEG